MQAFSVKTSASFKACIQSAQSSPPITLIVASTSSGVAGGKVASVNSFVFKFKVLAVKGSSTVFNTEEYIVPSAVVRRGAAKE